MGLSARQPFSARRNELRTFTIRVVGVDLSGDVAAQKLRMQVRLRADTPGVPLIDLATVASASAEGLKLASVVVTDGVPTSTITGRINKTTMSDATKLPYSGEVGDDSRLVYGIQLDGVTRLTGDFWALASAIDSNGAPTSRPISFGTTDAPQPFDSLTLTVKNEDVVEIIVDGASALGPLVAAAQAAADTATGAVPAIVAARDGALADIGGARTGALTDIAAAKVAAVADVTAALGVITDTEGVYILKAAGVSPGFYIANESIPVNLSVRRLYARVTGGTGSVSISVIKDGVQEIYGPIVVSTTKVEAVGVPLFVIPAKSDISILVESVTGVVSRLMVKIEGLPA